MWEEVGIKTTINLSGSYWSDMTSGKAYLTVVIDVSAYQANPWSVDWTSLVPMRSGGPVFDPIGLYLETKGELGMAPGPNPEYLPLAPEDTWAIDPTGNVKVLVEAWQDGRAYPMFSPERIALGKKIFDINATELYLIPTVGFAGASRGVLLNRNNVLNQPKTHLRDLAGFNAWAYYFIDGKDNFHHPDNMSGLKSFTFLGGG